MRWILIYIRSLNKGYDVKKAVKYAKKYALTRNKEYTDFSNNGGDCTNFISQCLDKGGLPYTNTWKPYSNAWLRVNELYYYIINNNIGYDVTKNKSYKLGDIVQFYSKYKGFFSHSGIITGITINEDYLYSCHSSDKLNYPLRYAFPIVYDKIRVIRIG